ncbi:hypothetical protein [Vallitalea guaymasensis]|uniref:hypothetical protein n=1 Tax=Vallitalea guaymasensis TaxID=1185412 RepID=UPI00272DC2CB|nr:hypothetical protein [Vallitalea guaymasensis]
MNNILKLLILISLISCMLIGCGETSNKTKTIDGINKQVNNEDGNLGNNTNNQKSNESSVNREDELNNSKEELGNIIKQELDIKNCQVIDEQILKPNRILVELNSYTCTNSVSVTSHDYIDNSDNSDILMNEISNKELEQKNINLERLDKDIFDKYTNILSPRLANEGIVFLVRDIANKNIVYIVKQQFNDESLEIIYTFDCDFNDRNSKGNSIYGLGIKTTDENIIYKFRDEVIIYNIEKNNVINHIKYGNMNYDGFDISSDGRLITFSDGNGSLIVSDIMLTNPKIIMKWYTDDEDEMNGSMPRYPSFSISSPNLLIFQLIGYEWSYGDMLYNISKDSFVKLHNNEDGEIQWETSAEWVGENLFMLIGTYDNYTHAFNSNNEKYVDIISHNKFQYDYDTDYGLSNMVIGTPLYNDNNQLVFIDVINKKLTSINNIQPDEKYISISQNGEYLITYSNYSNEYQLYKIDVSNNMSNKK